MSCILCNCFLPLLLLVNILLLPIKKRKDLWHLRVNSKDTNGDSDLKFIATKDKARVLKLSPKMIKVFLLDKNVSLNVDND